MAEQDKIKLSSIRNTFPMYADLSDDQLLMALRKKYYPDIPPGQFYNRIDYDTHKIDPTEGMSKTDKVLANIGAGMSDLGTGAKQLWTDMTGSDEEKAAMKQEVADKRARDRQLADATTGGTALQIAGGIIPTLAIPAGGFVNTARAGGSVLMNALRAARGIPAVASTAAKAGLGSGALLADSMLAGGTYGALTPVGEGESRTMNTIMGAGTGAVLPLALMGANQLRRVVTNKGGVERAGEELANEVLPKNLPQDQQESVLRQTISKLRNQPKPEPGSVDIPLSTAARLEDADLARLEAGSRARNGANWYDFDQGQAAAVADAVKRGTAAADELAPRRALRQNNIELRKGQAFTGINEGAFGNDMSNLAANLDVAMRSPEASNPAVLNMLKAIQGEMERLGENFTPQHLATIRQNLSAKFNPTNPNVYAAAPRDSAARLSVMREIDDILNNASNNRWQDVVSGYARDSVPVDAAKAAGRVRQRFWDADTGRVLGVSADAAGDVPKITEAGLGGALNAARGPDKSLLLSREANDRLEAVLGALRKQNIVQGVKRSATAGGGSNTSSDTLAAKAAGKAGEFIADQVPGGNALKAAFHGVTDVVNANKDRALAEALQNPQQMIQLLEARIKAGQPLGPAEAQLLKLLRGSVPAAGAQMMN
jgi:hypothetical protein